MHYESMDIITAHVMEVRNSTVKNFEVKYIYTPYQRLDSNLIYYNYSINRRIKFIIADTIMKCYIVRPS